MEKPPRLRPRLCSPCFFARPRRTQDRDLERLLEDLEFTPPREALVDRVPAAVLARQESPLRAGARDPEDGFKEAAHIAPGSEPDLGAGFQNGQNLLLLLVS